MSSCSFVARNNSEKSLCVRVTAFIFICLLKLLASNALFIPFSIRFFIVIKYFISMVAVEP